MNSESLLTKTKKKSNLNKLFQNLDIYYNIRPSGTEPLLRVNLQYYKRNIKVSVLKQLKKRIIKIISNAC